jgi:hypothetical protein
MFITLRYEIVVSDAKPDFDPVYISSLMAAAIGKYCQLCLHVVDIVSLKTEHVLLTPHMVANSRTP